MSTDKPSQTATVTEHEAAQVEPANASGRTPVMFVHGLWLLPSSWDRRTELLEAVGWPPARPPTPPAPTTSSTASLRQPGIQGCLQTSPPSTQ